MTGTERESKDTMIEKAGARQVAEHSTENRPDQFWKVRKSRREDLE